MNIINQHDNVKDLGIHPGKKNPSVFRLTSEVIHNNTIINLNLMLLIYSDYAFLSH